MYDTTREKQRLIRVPAALVAAVLLSLLASCGRLDIPSLGDDGLPPHLAELESSGLGYVQIDLKALPEELFASISGKRSGGLTFINKIYNDQALLVLSPGEPGGFALYAESLLHRSVLDTNLRKAGFHAGDLADAEGVPLIWYDGNPETPLEIFRYAPGIYRISFVNEEKAASGPDLLSLRRLMGATAGTEADTDDDAATATGSTVAVVAAEPGGAETAEYPVVRDEPLAFRGSIPPDVARAFMKGTALLSGPVEIDGYLGDTSGWSVDVSFLAPNAAGARAVQALIRLRLLDMLADFYPDMSRGERRDAIHIETEKARVLVLDFPVPVSAVTNYIQKIVQGGEE